MSILTGGAVEASDHNVTVPIGVPLPFFGSASYLPAYHLICNGDTIGDGSSGATGRANADTETLFTLLWNSIGNTELPIQTSAGAGSTRGASAAADFAAHKRLPLPDLRAYTIGGYKSGDTNFGTLGAKVGEATHVLTVAELASHRHEQSAYTGGGFAGGSFSGNTGTTIGGMGIYTQYTGGDTGHNNIQPTFTLNFIVRYKSFS